MRARFTFISESQPSSGPKVAVLAESSEAAARRDRQCTNTHPVARACDCGTNIGRTQSGRTAKRRASRVRKRPEPQNCFASRIPDNRPETPAETPTAIAVPQAALVNTEIFGSLKSTTTPTDAPAPTAMPGPIAILPPTLNAMPRCGEPPLVLPSLGGAGGAVETGGG